MFVYLFPKSPSEESRCSEQERFENYQYVYVRDSKQRIFVTSSLREGKSEGLERGVGSVVVGFSFWGAPIFSPEVPKPFRISILGPPD